MLASSVLLFLLVTGCDAAVEAEGTRPGGGMPADVAVAVMLLSTMTFVMATFYLTKSEDDDIRKASWQVLSTTISIFSAVLLFQGVNGTLSWYFLSSLEGFDRQKSEICLSFAHALFWYMVMQMALAWLTGAVTIAELLGEMKHESDSESDEEREREHNTLSRPTNMVELHKKQEAELNLKSWAVLLGHITGFACINCFGTLQQRFVGEDVAGVVPADAKALFNAATACVVSWIILQLLFSFAYRVRLKVSRSDDGELDEMEVMWDEETEDTEDDVLGLCVSFTIVQVLRYGITSRLPDAGGEVPPLTLVYSFGESFSLMGVGMFIFGSHIIQMLYVHTSNKYRRINEQWKVVSSMVFAWCFFFGMQWNVFVIVRLAGGSAEGAGMDTIRAVSLALFLTIVCYLMIFVLDKLADADWTGPEIDATITDLIKGLGILIGFSWEKSFDAAVTVSAQNMASGYVPRCAVKLLLSILLCSLVIPAWRWYILPELQQLGAFEEFAEDREIEDEMLEGGQVDQAEECRRMSARLTRKASRMEKKGTLLFDNEFAQEAGKRDKDRVLKLQCIKQRTERDERLNGHGSTASRAFDANLNTPLLEAADSADIRALSRDIAKQREQLVQLPRQIQETMESLGRTHASIGVLSPRTRVRRASYA